MCSVDLSEGVSVDVSEGVCEQGCYLIRHSRNSMIQRHSPVAVNLQQRRLVLSHDDNSTQHPVIHPPEVVHVLSRSLVTASTGSCLLLLQQRGDWDWDWVRIRVSTAGLAGLV